MGWLRQQGMTDTVTRFTLPADSTYSSPPNKWRADPSCAERIEKIAVIIEALTKLWLVWSAVSAEYEASRSNYNSSCDSGSQPEAINHLRCFEALP